MKVRLFKVGQRVHHEYDRLHHGTVIEVKSHNFYLVAWDAITDMGIDNFDAHTQLFADFNLRAVEDAWACDYHEEAN